MKRVLFLLFFILQTFSFAEPKFLEPDEAFQTKFTQHEDKLTFELTLGEKMYLYDERLKVYIKEPSKIDITKEVNLPKPENYEEFIVHFQNQKIDIPFDLLKSKIDSRKYQIEVQFQGCSTHGLCYAPMKRIYDLDLDSSGSAVDSNTQNAKTTDVIASEDLSETDIISNTLKNGNILLVLATFFGFGLLLSFTPCVFPMIPILSSIIVKASNEKKLTTSHGFFLSLVYVLSMAAAYTLAGVIAGLFGANLQVALQNTYVLSVFSAIFVALAFSMFGYYKLELPKSIQSKLNKTTDGQEKQGITGIAIMGFLSALIVGPCVAPPLAGALVYIGQTGDAFLGGLALFTMSIGMGVPLLLIGLGAGKYMPKPGGWMDSVSKVFGIVMLGVAIFMLERVVNPTIIMYLWALLALGSAIYLNIYKHLLAKLFTLIVLLYGVILFVGAVSGATNYFDPLEKLRASTSVVQGKSISFTKVRNIKELDLAIKNSSKPVMLDFYADWCIACKELENITFKDPKVIDKLSGFTLLKADVTENNDDDIALQKKYEIIGPPGLIFWDTNNKEIKAAKIVGFKDGEDFLEIVNKHF